MLQKLPKTFRSALLLTMILGLVAGATAFNWGPGGGMGGGGMGCPTGHRMGGGMMGKRGLMMNLTPEQAGQVFDLRQKFMNDTAGLRKELMMKAVEMGQLWKAEKPDEKAILAKVKELSALRGQFMEKAVAQRLEMKKIVPQWGGPMMGPGRMGPGKGACLPPGSADLAEDNVSVDLELAMNPENGW